MPSRTLGGDAHPLPVTSRTDVFTSQIVLVGAIIAVVGSTLALPSTGLVSDEVFVLGLVTIGCVTVLAGTAPWDTIDPRWPMAVALLDMVAIVFLRVAIPGGGFGFLMAFPVIWLAITYSRLGALVGAGAASAVLWVQTGVERLGPFGDATTARGLGSVTSLTITLVFIALIIDASSRRVAAHRRLLDRQTATLQTALTRSWVNERILREVMDSVHFGVISFDRAGRVIDTNKTARVILQQIEFPLDTPIERLPAYREDHRTPLKVDDFPHLRALRGERVEREVYWLGHADRPHLPVEVNARLLLGPQGDIERLVMVMRDVRDQMESSRARDELVTSISHEFRTPLSTILGYVDLAAEDPDLSDETREHLEIALRNTSRLLTLVGDLLEARSGSATGALTLTVATTDLASVVRESVETLNLLAADRIISLTVEAPPQLPIQGDAFRLRQVVDNLVSNAIKYNVHGGSVVISISADGDDVLLQVSDTGRAMTDREQRGLFERYYRAESAAGSTTLGTGLGLNISREIVELHHGTIDLDSRPGRGTTVSVRLPRHHPGREETA